MKKSQIDILADFIMAEVDGEPSLSEGAGDTAIRIIKQLQAEINTNEQQFKDDTCTITALQAEINKFKIAISKLLFSYNRHWIKMSLRNVTGISPTEIAESVVNAEQALEPPKNPERR